MAETYCGRSCCECTQKEELNCPGCKAGPGRQFGTDCELARCCRSKGHETCATCGFNGNCAALRTRDRQPEFRKRKMEGERQLKEAIAQRAPLLGKWLWILFWLIVPATVAGILGNNSMAKIAPGVYMAGRMLGAACSAAYGVILLRLSSAEDGYKISGICALAASAANVLLVLLSDGVSAPAWSLLISVPTAVVALVGEYSEYSANSIVLTDVDNALSEKWSMLWKWYIGFTIGIFGCILLLAVPILGMIGVIAVSIGTAVVSILKLVYLYRTAKVFRTYCA